MPNNNIEQEIINNFLEQPIEKSDFEKLYVLLLEIVKIINFKNITNKFKNFTIELSDDDDLYKQISFSEKVVSIDLCESIENEYFIAKSLIFYNKNDIHYSKKLVKIISPNRDEFRELAIKKWHYKGQGPYIKNLEEIAAIDYTKDIPIYSAEKYRNMKIHYAKCLTKNKNN